MKKFEGKVALVTGGSRGIGAAIAQALADAGADVAISYGASADQATAVADTLTRAGVRAAAFQADQARESAVTDLVNDVVAQFGRLDILINNAGVLASAPVGDPEADTAALDRQVAINYTAVVAAIRAAVPHMTEGGRIITIGSIVASRAPFPGLADYAATKAAVVGYTKGAVWDLAAKGITINVIQPGPVATDMNPADGPGSESQKALLAMGRYGQPEEVAAGVLFLASPEAAFITGAVLDIDGGFGA